MLRVVMMAGVLVLGGCHLSLGQKGEQEQSADDGTYQGRLSYTIGDGDGNAPTATQPQTAAPDPNLVAWYRFEEPDGAGVLDGSGNANNGNAQNVTRVPGRMGQGALFGGNGAAIRIADSASLRLLRTFTIETWLRLDSDGGAGYRLVTKGSSYALLLTPYGFALMIESNDVVSYAGPARRIGAWIHVAAVCDGQVARLYVDGKQVVQMGASGVSPSRTPDALVLGDGLAGTLDEVRIWSVARSDAEICVDVGDTAVTGPCPPIAPQPDAGAADSGPDAQAAPDTPRTDGGAADATSAPATESGQAPMQMNVRGAMADGNLIVDDETYGFNANFDTTGSLGAYVNRGACQFKVDARRASGRISGKITGTISWSGRCRSFRGNFDLAMIRTPSMSSPPETGAAGRGGAGGGTGGAGGRGGSGAGTGGTGAGGSAGRGGGGMAGGGAPCSITVDSVDPVVCTPRANAPTTLDCKTTFHVTIKADCPAPIGRVGVEFVDANFSHATSKFIDVVGYPGAGAQAIASTSSTPAGGCTSGSQPATRVDAFLYTSGGSMLADTERTDMTLSFECH